LRKAEMMEKVAVATVIFIFFGTTKKKQKGAEMADIQNRA